MTTDELQSAAESALIEWQSCREKSLADFESWLPVDQVRVFRELQRGLACNVYIDGMRAGLDMARDVYGDLVRYDDDSIGAALAQHTTTVGSERG